MKKPERAVRAQWIYRGFGFPIVLRHVPVVRIRGAWTPDLDYEALQRALLEALMAKGSPLTGEEVRFIRHASGLTLQAFARRFGVTHPAVMRWEKTGKRPTGMGWTTEKDVRLSVAARLGANPDRFVRIYRTLESKPSRKQVPIRLDLTSVA